MSTLRQRADGRRAMAGVMRSLGHPNWARHHAEMAERHEREIASAGQVEAPA